MNLHLFRTGPTVLAACLLAPLEGHAAPVFINPVSTQVVVDAFAVNSYIPGGTSRATNGSGPISDVAATIYGLNSATGTAAVDAAGLHATAVIHADPSNYALSSFGRGFAGITDPFIILPGAGFTGTQAFVQIPYALDGTLSSTCPSGSTGCSSGYIVSARLGVSGLSQHFSFDGNSAVGNIDYVSGGVLVSGILEGMLPVNTELYLVGGLTVQAMGQAITDSAGSEALFGNSLAFTGSSTDNVDIVWGLAPTIGAAVPEPAAMWLLSGGLVVLWLARRRGATRESMV